MLKDAEFGSVWLDVDKGVEAWTWSRVLSEEEAVMAVIPFLLWPAAFIYQLGLLAWGLSVSVLTSPAKPWASRQS